jgi:hypothetical protein
MAHRKTISIWFFIGVLLLIYGVLILGAGLYGMNAPTPGVTLGELHVDIWWGALLLLIGAFYTFHFSPTRQKN